MAKGWPDGKLEYKIDEASTFILLFSLTFLIFFYLQFDFRPLQVLLCKIPSQNQRIPDEKAWKSVFLFISNEPNQKLELQPEFSQLWHWLCLHGMR